MTRPREITALKRPHRIQVRLDIQLAEDLARVADAWTVPPATAAYWMLRGLMADARSESFVIVGDAYSEKLARWLVRKFPEEIGAK